MKKEKGGEKEKKKEKTKEENCEIFEMEKDGKEVIKEVCNVFEKDEEPFLEKESKRQNKIILNILILIGIFIIALIGGYYFYYSSTHYTFEDVKFSPTNVGHIKLYNTILPVYDENGNYVTDFNYYLRTNPKILSEIPFYGKLELLKLMAINMTPELDNCEGDGVIAIANLKNLMDMAGVKMVKDPNASCDMQGRFMYVDIKQGNETLVKRTGPACYDIYVKDCEVLKGTERFILETLAEIRSWRNK